MIRRAKLKDLDQINEMMDFYSLARIPAEVLKDLCLVSVRGQKVVGFIWSYFGKSKFIAYVDYLTVMPEAKGDGFRLSRAILKRFHRLQIKNVFTLVIQNGSDHSQQSFKINSRIGLTPHETPYHFFIGETERMAEQWVR